MRWVFAGAHDPEEAERARVVGRMDDALARITAALTSPAGEKRAPETACRSILRELDPRLDVEVFGRRDEPRVVVVNAPGDRRLRPLVDAFVQRAPRSEALRFVSRRPARPLEQAIEEVRNELGYELTNARARAGFARGHLIDVVIYGAGFAGRGDGPALDAAHAVVESLLGERAMDDWVGDVAAEPLPRSGPLRVLRDDAAPTFPLAELPAAVAAAVEGLRVTLPEPTRSRLPRDAWTLFESEPEPAHDYPAQDDVALAASPLPEMLKCFLEGSAFSSLRFTRGSEAFAYLKLDLHDVSFEERLARRNELEERLESVLADGQRGAVVGNGLGLRYAYLDLALALDREVLDVVCGVARDLGAPRRSWVQFCDTDWVDEWVGVWPDSPPPPGVCGRAHVP